MRYTTQTGDYSPYFKWAVVDPRRDKIVGLFTSENLASRRAARLNQETSK